MFGQLGPFIFVTKLKKRSNFYHILYLELNRFPQDHCVIGALYFACNFINEFSKSEIKFLGIPID